MIALHILVFLQLSLLHLLSQKENEEVVKKALENFEGRFELMNVMSTWTNRGLSDGFPEGTLHSLLAEFPTNKEKETLEAGNKDLNL